MSHVVVHAFGLLAIGGVVWLSGRAVLALRGAELGPWTHLASFCLGLAWWICGLFALAAAGFLNGWGLGLLMLGVAGAAWVGKGRFLERPRLPRSVRIGIVEVVFASLLGAVLLLTWFLTLSPQISQDADVYHLTLPRLYLEAGGFRPVPMNVYSNWPLATELLFAAAMLAGDYVLAKSVHFGFGLLTLYALFVGLSRAKGRVWGFVAAALFLANPVVASEIRAAYVDLAHAFFFVCALLFLDRALDDEEEHRKTFLALSGLSCGLMAGVKVSGIVGAAVIGALYLPRLAAAARGGRFGSEAAAFLVRFALPILVLWVPWLIKTFLFTGNPFYPFFHDALGGADWSAALDERFRAWQSSIGMGREPLDYLLLPVRVALLGGQGYASFDGRIHPLWIVLVPLALVLGRRDPLVRRSLVAAGLAFVFWAVSSQQVRFLIPVLALLAAAAAAALSKPFAEAARAGWRYGLVLAGALGLVLWVYATPLVSGFKSFVVFLRFEGDLVESVIPRHHRFLNENLNADERVLFLNTNRGFFCRREYLADSFFEASQIADWLGDAGSVEEVRRRLGERGITHVLLDRRPFVENLPPELFELLRQAQVLFRSPDGRYVVFGIDRSRPVG